MKKLLILMLMAMTGVQAINAQSDKESLGFSTIWELASL